jgi:hypothetical protein
MDWKWRTFQWVCEIKQGLTFQCLHRKESRNLFWMNRLLNKWASQQLFHDLHLNSKKKIKKFVTLKCRYSRKEVHLLYGLIFYCTALQIRLLFSASKVEMCFFPESHSNRNFSHSRSHCVYERICKVWKKGENSE